MFLKRATEALFGIEAAIAKRWSSAAHKRLFMAQWGLGTPPEHFDHSIDLHWKWTKTGASYWLERGVFGGLALKGGDVLELSCGDGFNAKHFYADRSRSVTACDFDPAALKTARAKNAAANVRFVLADIRTDMPEGQFSNVVWDAAIEHFNHNEIGHILGEVKRRLEPGGILSGYTLAEKDDGRAHLHTHEIEFSGMADLKALLTPHFANVRVFETVHPERHNLYFWASDGEVPFAPGWARAI